jgi:hypothetical protein
VEYFCERRDIVLKGKGKGKRCKCITKWEGSKRPQELNQLLRNIIMVRCLKADVLEQLPEKRGQLVKIAHIQPDQAVMAKIEALMKANAEACARLEASIEEG